MSRSSVNGPEITRALKPVLKDAYNYDSTVSAGDLWFAVAADDLVAGLLRTISFFHSMPLHGRRGRHRVL